MNDVYGDLADMSEENKQQFKNFKRVVFEVIYLRVRSYITCTFQLRSVRFQQVYFNYNERPMVTF